ncbi:hypothetical protein KM043_010000 [Ampulex compressa]|nr:hypothetical protein KM043_010000 [Ampulex compressa]
MENRSLEGLSNPFYIWRTPHDGRFPLDTLQDIVAGGTMPTGLRYAPRVPRSGDLLGGGEGEKKRSPRASRQATLDNSGNKGGSSLSAWLPRKRERNDAPFGSKFDELGSPW